MSSTKPLLYDLGIALGAMSLWATPFDISRILGYSISLVFSADAYYRGVTALSKQRRDDEKEAISYEAETDFYDQLLGSNIEAELEVRALQIETRMIERILPLMAQKKQLEIQLQHLNPHPELSDEDKEEAAKQAIDSAFPTSTPQIDEMTIREHYPETLDGTSWKAICKALQGGATREEIIKDVLGGSQQISSAYFELLKRRYLG